MRPDPRKFSPLVQDVLYGQDRSLFDDDVGRALMRIFGAGVCDGRIAGMIRHRVDKDRLGQALSGMPFREPRLGEGAFVIGLDLSGRVPRRMPIQYLNAHTLTVANTGAGKTIRGKFYALQIAPQVRGMWLLDLRKREFRVLRPYLARVGVDMVVLDARALQINPLQVPLGVTPVDWTSRVSDMLIQVLGLPPRASKLVQTVLFRLYQKFSVFDGAKRYPTIFDLYEAVRADEKSNPPARLALLDSLDPALRSLGPQVLAYRYGWTSTDLAARHLAIEFGGIGEVEKNLLLNSLVLPEFTSRVARGISNPRMDLWILCDEAHRLCSAAGSGQTGAIADLVGLVRGTGIGLDLSVLSTADLAPQVLSNTATKIMGRCGSAADYAAAGHSIGLTADQIQWAQLHLKPGRFIGQLGEGDWRYPFVFTVPKMTFPARGPADASDLDLGPLADLPTVPAPEFRSWGKAAPLVENAAAGPVTDAFAAETEYRFCRVVLDHPMQPSSRYARLAGMSSKTALAARRRLVASGYLREHRVQAAGRGRSAILLEATAAAEAAVEAYESGRKGP